MHPPFVGARDILQGTHKLLGLAHRVLDSTAQGVLSPAGDSRDTDAPITWPVAPATLLCPLRATSFKSFQREPSNCKLFLHSYDNVSFLFQIAIYSTVSRTPRLPVPIPFQLLSHPIQRAPQSMGLACGEKEGSGSSHSPISPMSGASAAFTCPDLWPHEL